MARVRLDHGGMRDMLRSAAVEAAIVEAAAQVAAAAEQTATVIKNEAPILAGPWAGNDRAGASVTIAHPGGRAMEAKHGPLARSARSAGLSFAEWSSARRKRRRKRKTDDDVS